MLRHCSLVVALIAAGCAASGGTHALPPLPASARGSLPSVTRSLRLARYRLMVPLRYDGASFAPVAVRSCGQVRRGSAPPYVAPTGGRLKVTGNVVVPPECVPSPLPSNPPLLYVIALRDGHRLHPRIVAHPRRGGVVRAFAIAGPANLTDNPWSFSALAPGLTMSAGGSYRFFVGAAVGVVR